MTPGAVRSRAVAIAAVLAAIPAALVILAVPAGAATRGCSNVQGGQCGSQELVGAPLMLAAHVRTSRSPAAELKTASSSKPTEDFRSLRPPDQPLTGSGTFELARNGHPSGLCLTGTGNSVIFATCNLASFSDQWMAYEPPGAGGYTMRLRGSDDYLMAPPHAKPYMAISLGDGARSAAVWSFVG
jgi:hypothetical protein